MLLLANVTIALQANSQEIPIKSRVVFAELLNKTAKLETRFNLVKPIATYAVHVKLDKLTMLFWIHARPPPLYQHLLYHNAIATNKETLLVNVSTVLQDNSQAMLLEVFRVASAELLLRTAVQATKSN